MRTNKFILFIACFLISTCFSCDAQKKTKAKPKKVIVLCDLTTSIDPIKTKGALKQNLKQIFMSLGASTDYIVYAIGNATPVRLCNGNTRKEQPIYLKNKHFFDKCEAEMESKYETRSDGTCIITAINNLSGEMNNDGFEKTYLIILSDLLEVCTTNGVFVNFEKNNFKSGEKLLKEWPADDIYFKNDNLDIMIMCNSNKDINYSELRRFWKNFFKKTGYKKDVRFVGSVTEKDFQN